MDRFAEPTKHLIEKAIAENDGITVDYILPDKLSKKIEGYMSMAEDLKLCLYALDQFDMNRDKNLLLCLHYSLISLYGKCFMKASVDQYPKLEENECFKDLPSLMKIHMELIEFRHHFVAHRGKTLNESFLPIFQINSINLDQSFKIKLMKKSAPDADKILSYREIIKHLLEIIDVKREKAVSKAYRHLTKNYSPEKMNDLLLDRNK